MLPCSCGYEDEMVFEPSFLLPALLLFHTFSFGGPACVIRLDIISAVASSQMEGGGKRCWSQSTGQWEHLELCRPFIPNCSLFFTAEQPH